MATSKKDDFAIYCCDLLSGVGPCSFRRMFGGYGISTDGLTFALVADLGGGEKLWLKADAETSPRFEAEGCERFRYATTRGGMSSTHSLNYYSAPEETMESPALMLPWARLSLESAVKARPAPKKPKPVAAKKKPPRPGKKLRP
ncbi:MAG: TfoX/Sxy family protein [Polaromonas sp.]|uniref:TfoX/Sxy family protein n=1 Tax=Polaromonas sp. TaxID=1869339 RepID=UPI0025D16DF8|nr:TfoX/Sxy family protein [Polaromonas sp.]MBI2727468.1 TfoX/Sxy family protein [Polaromonas sp.]